MRQESIYLGGFTLSSGPDKELYKLCQETDNSEKLIYLLDNNQFGINTINSAFETCISYGHTNLINTFIKIYGTDLNCNSVFQNVLYSDNYDIFKQLLE